MSSVSRVSLNVKEDFAEAAPANRSKSVGTEIADASLKALDCLNRAKTFWASSQYTEMAKATQEGLAAHPTEAHLRAELHLIQAIALKCLGQYSEALEETQEGLYAKKIATQVKASLLSVQAHLLNKLGRQTEVLDSIPTWPHPDSMNKEITANLHAEAGIAFTKEGLFSQAKKEAAAGLKAEPTDKDTLSVLHQLTGADVNLSAQLYLKQAKDFEANSQYTEMEKAAQEGLDAEPTDVSIKTELHTRLAIALKKLGQFQKALEETRRGLLCNEKIEPNTKALLCLVQTQVMNSLGRYAEVTRSIPTWPLAASIDKEIRERLYVEAGIAFTLQSLFSQAREAAKIGLSLEPTNEDTLTFLHRLTSADNNLQALFCLNRARAFGARSQYAEMAKEMEVGLAAEPTDVNLIARLHLGRATALNQQGLYAQARRATSEGLKAAPTDRDLLAQLYLERARAFKKKGSHRNALRAAIKGLKAESPNLETRAYLRQLSAHDFDETHT